MAERRTENPGALSVVGLGKLGLCMAACFARKGYPVIGVDVNQLTVEAVNQGRSPIYEPGLGQLIKDQRGRLRATTDHEYAIQNSDVTFVVVPTPSDKDGGFSIHLVEQAARQIAVALKGKSAFHVVAVTSTVLPGATAGVIRPLMEEVSGKQCGVDFGLCYNPEFIALGSVIRDFTAPDVILIGESDKKSGQVLSEIYRKVCDNDPPVVRTTMHNAELAKISINSFVTMKISFANTIAEICEALPGGDADAVSRALGCDSRIGRKYLSGGLGFGGPCFPRDNRAFVSLARRLGRRGPLAEATDEVNQSQTSRILRLVRDRLGGLERRRIAILGLAYKRDTNIVEESAAMRIAQALLQEGACLSVYDPAALDNARLVLGDGVKYSASIEDCLKDTELCILATLWKEFETLQSETLRRNMKEPRILDCWRALNRKMFSDGIDYIAIGLGPEQEG